MIIKRRRCLVFIAVLAALFVLSSCNSGTPVEDTGAENGEGMSRETETVETALTFSGGNYDFVRSYEVTPDACQTQLSIVEHNGANALLLDVSSGGKPVVAIDVSSLLGEDVARLHTMQLIVEVASRSGEFFAVSGELVALRAADGTQSTDAWSVYLPNKNPNGARAVLETDSESFAPGPYNMILFSKEIDNGEITGEAPSNILIHAIEFFDEAGVPLIPDANAGFNAPEGFGKADSAGLIAVENEITIAGSSGESVGGWGQAVAMVTAKNDGDFDGELLGENSVITVYYVSAVPPELIFQSWTEGAPDSAGWAKIAPAHVNASGTVAQFMFSDMVSAFGSDGFAEYLDQVFVGDTGEKLNVASVTVGDATGGV